jgi:ElaB/YqjD/DUF883 family membrane-anchored ribosome-binding protein
MAEEMRTMSEAGATKQLRHQVNRVGGDLRDLAATAGQAAREQIGNVRQAATEYVERGVEGGKSMEHALEDYIRESPLRSTLIAAGIGLLLGIMFRRR